MQNSSLVYKYFDLIDGFIRVRIANAEASMPQIEIATANTPSRRDYRQYIVNNFIIDLKNEVMPKVHAVYPEDTMAAEDLLYQICVDVNPSLEIHSVALPVSTEGDASTECEKLRFRQLAEDLQENVLAELVGQDDAVNKICRSIRKAAVGLNDPERPIGSFLLVGRTGTGKTELAKSVSRHLLDGRKMVRIDCSEYALAHETAKLIGAPPGYIGHSEGGMLTSEIEANPRAVVLFDELEKGHEKLHNMLLQILDDARLTDSKGTTVDFSQCLILMTSNVGTADYAQATSRLGFEQPESLAKAEFNDITQLALRNKFKPELLNRLDGIITFRSLSADDCLRIAELQLKMLQQRMQGAEITLKWTKALCRAVATAGYSEEYGAREVRRAISRMIEEPLSNAILDGKMPHGAEVKAGWKAGAVEFKTKSAA
ncbi:MAG: ATP-dependent Clp protease ATP-binding subunit ClpC [Myxococcota bacterium]|jgi:ATP-dependent Clp protease ATP-binding subunit ClpC